MRELILLRHAHAEPAGRGQADIDRPLSATGLAEAEAAGRWLQQHHLVPDRVLCSPARRTRETLQNVLEVIGFVEQRLVESIYDASAGTLVGALDAHADVQRVMLVGHNPGLEHLVALLNSGQSSDYRGMPPAGIAVLHLDEEAPIEPGAATLANFWWP